MRCDLFCLGCLISCAFGYSGSPARQQNFSGSEFVFVRIQYNGYDQGAEEGSFAPPWAHDFPRAERNLLKLLAELAPVQTNSRSHLVLRLDDPEIMDYPFLYVSEPGFWDITEAETHNLREFLDGGGFVLFDDFRGQAEWDNLVASMRQVYPDRGFRKLTIDEPVFQCYLDIESLEMPAPYQAPGKQAFYGIFDESGRLQVVAAANNDIGDYWDWSDERIPPKMSDQAYRFGINFVLYALDDCRDQPPED